MALVPVVQTLWSVPWEGRALGVLVAGVMFVRYGGGWGRVYSSAGRPD